MIQCIRYEFYKFFMVKRGFWLFAAYLALQLVLNSIHPLLQYQKESAGERYYLNRYYAMWGGEIEDRKAEAIENRLIEIQKMENAYNEAQMNFRMGGISGEEYISISKASLPGLEQKRIFEKFYKNYAYCKKMPEKSWLIRTEGWELLLYNQDFNYFLVILAIFIGSVTYSAEYSHAGLSEMLKTTRHGGDAMFFAKLCSMAVLVLFLQLADLLAAVGVICVHFRLSDFEAPIQSVYAFRAVPFSFSLGIAVFLLFLSRTCGLIYLASGAALLAILSKKGYVGFMAAFFSAIIAYFLFEEGGFLFYLPLPPALISAKGLMLSGHLWNNMIASVMIVLFMIFVMRTWERAGGKKQIRWKKREDSGIRE